MSLRYLEKLWLLLLYFLLCSAVCVQSQSTCTAGDDNQSSDDESSNENFYANLRSNDRASCAGTVVAWHYCYYTDVSSGDTYEFDAAMYREQNDSDLELISGSLRNIRLTGSDIMSAGGSFACDTLSLDEAEQFEVQVGDVVAACIRDRGGSRKALRMISEDGPDSSSVVTAFTSVCDSPNLINDNELSSQQHETVLHLYVDIQVPPPPTTMPSQEPTTAPPTTMPSEESTTGAPTTQVPCSAPLGNSNQEQYTLISDDLFLLDVDHPAQCDGTVESLSYCVYQRVSQGFIADNINSPHEAYVAVFRPETNGVYNRVSNFTTFSQLQFDIDDPVFFGCFEQATSLTVQTGDVLGVCQVDPGLGTGRLNVIGTGAPSGNSLLVANSNRSCTNIDQTSSVDINDGSFQEMDGYVMHIQADISITLTSTLVTPTNAQSASSTTAVSQSSTLTTVMSSVSSTAPPQDTPSATTSTISSMDVPIQSTSASSNPNSSTSQPEPVTSSSPSTTSTQAIPTSDSADIQTEIPASASVSISSMTSSTTQMTPVTHPTTSAVVIGASIAITLLVLTILIMAIVIIVGVIVQRKTTRSSFIVTQPNILYVNRPEHNDVSSLKLKPRYGRGQQTPTQLMVTENMSYGNITVPAKCLSVEEYADVNLKCGEDHDYTDIDDAEPMCSDNVAYSMSRGQNNLAGDAHTVYTAMDEYDYVQ